MDCILYDPNMDIGRLFELWCDTTSHSGEHLHILERQHVGFAVVLVCRHNVIVHDSPGVLENGMYSVVSLI